MISVKCLFKISSGEITFTRLMRKFIIVNIYKIPKQGLYHNIPF